MDRNTRQTLLALPLLALVSGCQWNDDPASEAQPDSVEGSAGTASRPSADKAEQAFPGRAGALKTATLVDADGEETEITYEVINGLAVYQGDIILGKDSKLESQLQGAGIELRTQRWPNRVVYYAIDPTLPEKNRVSDAIVEWESNTDMVFVQRTNQSNYVYFTNSSGCSSSVGMVSGRQDINLTTGKDYSEIRGMAISKSNDWVYTWYSDGMVSAGGSRALDDQLAQYAFTLPSGYVVSDIIDLAIAPNGDKVYAFYQNGKYSVGTSADLDYYAQPQSYTLPVGYSSANIAGMDFASTGKLYVWYTNNKMSIGTAADLDAHAIPSAVVSDIPLSNAVGMGIAGSTDYVYSWYLSGTGATGWSGDLNAYSDSFAYAPPGHCSTGSVIHEIGHAIGLYHEQSRCDRDAFVTVNWENITSGKEHNFDNHCGAEGRDLASYDFDSIMHYGSYAFSSNDEPTLVKKDGSTFTVQRDGLSVKDIQAAAELYGFSPAGGRTSADVVGIAIGSNDYVYSWNDDGKVSYGNSYDHDAYSGTYSYTLPAGLTTANIVAMSIAKSTSKVYTWYNNGKMSVGTSSDLDYYQGLTSYSLPSGYSAAQLAGIGIAPGGDKVYAWYTNGYMSIGSSVDLDAHKGPTVFSLPPGLSASDLVEVDIAASTSYVYAWFKNYSLTVGTSNDLDAYQAAW